MPEKLPEHHVLSAHWAVREVDTLLSRFARYTRFVIYSKWFLGVFALGLMGSLIAYPLLTKDRSGIRVSFNSGVITDASKASTPVMSNPEYHGSGDKGQQYRVNGTRATQATPSLIVIDQVDGQLVQPDGALTSLTAIRADYHQDEKKILLQGAVNVSNDKGYHFVTEEATVDTHTMDVVGDVPVRGNGPLGNLLASAFEIRENGNRLLFKRGSLGQIKLVVERKKNA